MGSISSCMKISRHQGDISDDNVQQQHEQEDGFYCPAYPIKPFDILPLSIPRIKINKKNTDTLSPRTFYDYLSPPFTDSPTYSFLSKYSNGCGLNRRPINTNLKTNSTIPLKKIIKESRWISVHDGQPVSPYFRTVFYVPYHQDNLTALFNKNYPSIRTNRIHPKREAYEDARYVGKFSDDDDRLRTSLYDPCSLCVENPLYQD